MDNKKLKDRRTTVRYPIKISVDVELQSGKQFSVDTINFSRDGLQFKGDQWIANTIEPRGIQHHALDHIDLMVSISIPFDHKMHLQLRSQIVHAERLSQDTYEIGLEFTDVNEEDARVIEQLIEYSHT